MTFKPCIEIDMKNSSLKCLKATRSSALALKQQKFKAAQPWTGPLRLRRSEEDPQLGRSKIKANHADKIRHVGKKAQHQEKPLHTKERHGNWGEQEKIGEGLRCPCSLKVDPGRLLSYLL